MQDYLALVVWTETSIPTGEIISKGSDCFDFKAKNHEDMKDELKKLEREESLPPRSRTVYKVMRVWKVKEIKLT